MFSRWAAWGWSPVWMVMMHVLYWPHATLMGVWCASSCRLPPQRSAGLGSTMWFRSWKASATSSMVRPGSENCSRSHKSINRVHLFNIWFLYFELMCMVSCWISVPLFQNSQVWLLIFMTKIYILSYIVCMFSIFYLKMTNLFLTKLGLTQVKM